MTTKHTPGPWQIHSAGVASTPDMTIHQGDTFKASLRRPPVCILPECNTKTAGETVANARLIASAPELLEALQRVLAWAGMYRDSLAWESGKREIEAARAAIAKATGE